jgi:hypothetical protein
VSGSASGGDDELAIGGVLTGADRVDVAAADRGDAWRFAGERSGRRALRSFPPDLARGRLTIRDQALRTNCDGDGLETLTKTPD